MEEQSNLIITQTDYEKISALSKTARPEIAELLEEELSRASIVADDQLPENIVAMNSKVTFKDLDTKKDSTVTLVYPQEADVDANKISILAPIGAALIGLRVGQTIEWPLPNGKERSIQVISVAQDK